MKSFGTSGIVGRWVTVLDDDKMRRNAGLVVDTGMSPMGVFCLLVLRDNGLLEGARAADVRVVTAAEAEKLVKKERRRKT